MGGALGWVLNPGGEAANLVVPISPHTQSLIGAIEAADPPCSSGNTVQDWVCWGGTLAAGEVYGRARQALEKTGPHGAVVGTLLNFGEGAVGNASDFMRAVRIGADAGVPGYAYDTVTIGDKQVTIYADATRVPGGGSLQAQIQVDGTEPLVLTRAADRRGLEDAQARVIDEAQDTVHPYLGDKEGFSAAHEAARARSNIESAIVRYKTPPDYTPPSCNGGPFLCP
jgi:hypothetical protein